MGGGKRGDDGQSDDEVPPPLPVPPKGDGSAGSVTVCQKFQQLNSVVCAYKQLLIDPRDPKEKNFTFNVCAKMCDEEVEDLAKWSPSDKVRYYPAIISALHIVYPNNGPAFYKKWFLQSPETTAEYWGKCLSRRAEL